TLWIAGPSLVGDFHPLIFTGLPAHTVFIYSISAGRFSQLCRLKQNVKKAELAPGFGHHTYRLNNRREHMEQLLNGLHEVNYCLDQVCRELHKLKNIYHVHFPLNELRVSGGEPIAAL
ncbi:hypothetical protein ACR2XJ_24305, partial [Klebsiella pneumoniae]